MKVKIVIVKLKLNAFQSATNLPHDTHMAWSLTSFLLHFMVACLG